MKQGKKTTKIEALDALESIRSSLQNEHTQDTDYLQDTDQDIPVLDDLVIDDNINLDYFEKIVESPSASRPPPSPRIRTENKRSPEIAQTKARVNHSTKKTRFLEETHKSLKVSLPKNGVTENSDNNSSDNNSPDNNPFLPAHIRERLLQNKKQASQFYESLNAADNGSLSGHALLGMSIHESVSQAVASFVADLTQDKQLKDLAINMEDSTVAIIDRLTTLYLPVFESQMRQQFARLITQTKSQPINEPKPFNI